MGISNGFPLQNKVTYCVQTSLLGGWIDVYVNGRCKLTKKFTSIEELESIKRSIENIIVSHLLKKELNIK